MVSNFIPLTHMPVTTLKGRGTAQQIAHRFAVDEHLAFDDGWGTLEHNQAEANERAPVKTEVIFQEIKSAISYNDSPDLPFSATLNPYRGCEHGCIYCFARPTHSYLGLSPGLDFESKIIAKRNIGAVLQAELAKPSYRPSWINLGAATDCYQPVERELKLTREVLQILHDCQHPFAIVTKSATVERDIDLIAPMAAKGLAVVYITITTLDADLARILEPRAATPARRLKTIATLKAAGIPVGVSVSPQIPFINEDMENVLEAARIAGAERAFYTVLRLPWEVSPLFETWLHTHFPQRAERVMARVREMRDGKNYDANFATRMKGSGVWAELIRNRFTKATQRLGYLTPRFDLSDIDFVPPKLAITPAENSAQASLF